MTWTSNAIGFDQLDPSTRRSLDHLTPMEVPKGSVLFRPGDTAKGYVIVLEGQISVNLIGPGGRDITLYRVEPGQTCIQTTLGLMGGEEYSGEAVAETDAKIILMSRDIFMAAIENSSGFRRLVFSAFAARVQTMMHLLENVAFQPVEQRLTAFILDQANNDDVLEMTQADLATAIGSAREVISRRLEILESRGCIERKRGRVIIRNPEMLRQVANKSLM